MFLNEKKNQKYSYLYDRFFASYRNFVTYTDILFIKNKYKFHRRADFQVFKVFICFIFNRILLLAM